MSAGARSWDVLGRAIGAPADMLVSRLGEPVTRRISGDDLWLVYEAPGRRLRVRCNASEEAAVASWTVSFDAGPATLREAAEQLGLWPHAAPDVVARDAGAAPILRAVTAEGEQHSLVANPKDGRIHKVTLFDEAPEWL